MFDNLTEKLERAFKVLKGQGYITEINVSETVKEVRKALLDADVSYKIAKDFTDEVKKKSMGMNVLKAVSPGQLMVKIVYDELISLMGREAAELNLKHNPAIVLMAGLQGSGKTTHSAKLAYHLKNKKGKKPLMVACDVYRPAAIEQLKVLGENIQVDVFSDLESKKPVEIAKKAVSYAKDWGYDVVIIDTAGRLAIDQQMMDEIGNIKSAVNPHEILFVVDAMTGQDAVNTAKAFNDKLNFDGVILTKLDGDSRGGSALTIKAVVNKPIKFVGVGEKMDALDIFHPDRMAERILGMGDVRSLVERAQEQIDETEAAKFHKKIAKNQLDFNDFLSQIKQIRKMGNVKDLLGMVPGMGKAIKNMDFDNDAFIGVEAIIYSMTPEERQNPNILNASRKKRIAEGSGKDIIEVNRLIKQFEEMRKIMRNVSHNNSFQMLKKNKNFQ